MFLYCQCPFEFRGFAPFGTRSGRGGGKGPARGRAPSSTGPTGKLCSAVLATTRTPRPLVPRRPTTWQGGPGRGPVASLLPRERSRARSGPRPAAALQSGRDIWRGGDRVDPLRAASVTALAGRRACASTRPARALARPCSRSPPRTQRDARAAARRSHKLQRHKVGGPDRAPPRRLRAATPGPAPRVGPRPPPRA